MESVKNRVEHLLKESIGSCGSSYDVFVEKFSGCIDGLLAGERDHREKEMILQVAREHDYMTKDQIEKMHQESEENGYCDHGIELGCCPAGC